MSRHLSSHARPLALRALGEMPLPVQINWVLPRLLAGFRRPGLLADVSTDLTRLISAGIRAVVCLEESTTSEYRTAIAHAGLELLCCPVLDMAAPAEDAAHELCRYVNARLDTGAAVGVHCRAGLGRTGTILAAVLISRGETAGHALQRVRRVEPRFVQSTSQVQFLRRFARLAIPYGPTNASPITHNQHNTDIGASTMSLDKALNTAQTQVPECVAVGYVDMATGMLLSVKTVDSHPAEVLDLIAAATADMFQGSNVVAIEKMFKKARGLNNDAHYFKEMIVFSDNLLHVFLRGKSNHQHALVFVCRGSANVGMVLTKSRLALAPIEAAL